MGRRRRHFEPEGIYFVTNRCAGGRFLLRPSPAINGIIRGALAKYADKWDVELFGWMFMSNHFHMIPRSRSLQIPQFMRDFQRKVSHEVKKVVGWDLSVFPKRYHCEKICDEGALRQKMRYMLLNPVRAGLVRRVEDWPGVSSWDCHADGEPMKGRCLDRELWREMRRQSEDGRVGRSKACVPFWVMPARLPWDVDASDRVAGQNVVEAVKSVEKDWGCRASDEARLKGEGFLGAKGVMEQNPFDKPQEFEPSLEPLCHAADPNLRERYRARYELVMERYDEVMETWQADETAEVEFPAGTWPPGWVKGKPYEAAPADGSGGPSLRDPRGGAPVLDRIDVGAFADGGAQSGVGGGEAEEEPVLVGASESAGAAAREADSAREDPEDD